MDRNLFVYGTLRKACAHEMHGVLARVTVFVGEGTVHGTLYDLGSYPGLAVVGENLERVTGEVYALDPDRLDATLAILDAYEGCAPADREPHEYRRDVVQVTLDDGSKVAAWTYVLNRPHAGLTRIPDGDYVGWRRGCA